MYLTFCWQHYSAKGGMDDCDGKFSSYQEAMDKVMATVNVLDGRKDYDLNFQIYSTEDDKTTDISYCQAKRCKDGEVPGWYATDDKGSRCIRPDS